MKKNQTHHNRAIAGGLEYFYREAGSADAPLVLLLHGCPTSSFMFRNLIPRLAEKYHVIAPDLPGFGFSDAPLRKDFSYTFENLADSMQLLIDKLALNKFAIYIFDYGATVGLRLALNNPERIRAIISQNGNAYLEGLSPEWNQIQKYWQEPTTENRLSLKDFISAHVTRFQYEHGVSDCSLIAPETYTLDQHFLDQPERVEIQLDLILDYQANLAMYPKFQAYFRNKKPPVLAVWGNKDPYFLPAGAESYKKDNPEAKVKFYNTGHFALETHGDEIADEVLDFLDKLTL